MIVILFGVLIFVFIFLFGPQAQGLTADAPTTDPSGWAARVNGEVITQREVTMSTRRQGVYRNESSSPKLNRDSLLQLVDLKLIEQRGRAAGITASEEELDAFLVSKQNGDWPYLYSQKGRFDSGRYKSLVQRLGVSPEVYRDAKRSELIVQRYIALLSSQVKVSEAEVRQIFDRSKRTWTLEYIAVDPSTFEVTDASAEEGAAFAKKNPDAVKAYYDANNAVYNRSKEVKIRRVLVKPSDDKEGKAAARKKLEGFLALAKAEGADFASIATTHSEGHFKSRGGDMGWRAASNSSKTAFAVYSGLKKGEVSTIQDTIHGLWFVQAADVRPAVAKTLENVTGEIGIKLAKSDRQKAAAMVEAKAMLAKAKGVKALADALPPVPVAPPVVEGEAAVPAPVAKYSVDTTSPIRESRQSVNRIPGMGESAELAGLLSTLTEKAPLVGKVLEIDGKLYITRLKDHTEPTDEEFAKSKEDLTGRVQSVRMQKLFGGWQQMLFNVARLHSQGSLFGTSALFASLADGAKTELNEAVYPKDASKTKGAKASR